MGSDTTQALLLTGVPSRPRSVASSLPVAIRDALTLACHLRIETVLVRSLGSTAALLGPDAGTRLHADATHDDSSCAPASRGTAEWPGSAPRQACGWLLRAQALSAKAEGAVLREEPQEVRLGSHVASTCSLSTP